MSGGGPKPQQGPVQQFGGGFMQPGVMTIDPTPPAIKPMQSMLAQMMMARIRGGGQALPPSNLPTFGNMGSIFDQLYGGASGGIGGSGGPVAPPVGPPPDARRPGTPIGPPIGVGGGMIRPPMLPPSLPPSLPPTIGDPFFNGPGPTAPPTGWTPHPRMPQIPLMPSFGDVVSGSRMIRSMQPQYTNQAIHPLLRRMR